MMKVREYLMMSFEQVSTLPIFSSGDCNFLSLQYDGQLLFVRSDIDIVTSTWPLGEINYSSRK